MFGFILVFISERCRLLTTVPACLFWLQTEARSEATHSELAVAAPLFLGTYRTCTTWTVFVRLISTILIASREAHLGHVQSGACCAIQPSETWGFHGRAPRHFC